MKLDLKCVRDIMLQVEVCEFGEVLNFPKLQNVLSGYSEEELAYCCMKISEGKLIDAQIVMKGHIPRSIAIYDLTYNGHEFLNTIRTDKILNCILAIAKEIGISSLSGFMQIGASILTQIVRNHFGF